MKLLSLLLSIALYSTTSHALNSELDSSPVKRGEICTLLSVDRNEMNGDPGIVNVSTIAFIGEKGFNNNPDRIRDIPTTLVLTFTHDIFTDAKAFPAKQNTSFELLDGTPIKDTDTFEGDELNAVYTHVFENNVPGKANASLVVKHYVYIKNDNWHSTKAVATYKYQSLQSKASAHQVYTFNCLGN